VERIVEYLNIPQEPPLIIESNRPPAYWPSNSDNEAMIDVEDLVIVSRMFHLPSGICLYFGFQKYAADLPPVLHNISFKLKAQEKIGLVGRTGSVQLYWE